MKATDRYQSWGRYPQARRQTVLPVRWTSDPLPQHAKKSLLPRGRGLSQGDVCLNDGGVLLDTRGLDRWLEFDPAFARRFGGRGPAVAGRFGERGRLRCEAGITLGRILQLIVPQGWFLPVVPGTQFVTVGGAIANDVHGKNHHKAGTFGRHVVRFELLRSDGTRLVCSARQNKELFAATIGGLGLTGLITWAELELAPIRSATIDMELLPMASLDDFFRLVEESDTRFDFTVAWVDCLARGRQLGRGLFWRGNFSDAPADGQKQVKLGSAIHVPAAAPSWLVSQPAVRLFNWFYRHQPRGRRRVAYPAFFFPLDRLGYWNRLYGAAGFFQYQCALPPQTARDGIRALLTEISDSGLPSFLSTLKVFGAAVSPGMLSFPRPGVALAVDFANRGQATLNLFARLDRIVAEAGGALYPAKDSRMPGHLFRRSFPRWREFSQYVDPGFSSSFWRRVST